MDSNLEKIKNSKIGSLIEKTEIFDFSDTIPRIISRLKEDRSEIFALKNNTCYFINNRLVLDKKKINPSMKINSECQVVPILKKTDTISKAMDIFSDYKVNAIPVVNNKKIIGEVRILSILKKLSDQPLLAVKQTEELMLEKIKSPNNKSLSFVRNKLKQNNLDALPIEKDGKVDQIITSHDLIKILNPPQKVGKLGTKGKDKIRSLEPQVGNLGDQEFPKSYSKFSIKDTAQSMIENQKPYCIISSQSGKENLLTAHSILEFCNKSSKRNIPIKVIGKRKNELMEKISSKLESVLEKFSKVQDDVIEVRVSLEEEKTTGKEILYIINFLLITQKNQTSFSTKAWSLNKGISEIRKKISSHISSKRKKDNNSIRKKSKMQILAEIGK
ncbi:MAG: CBS domain-containing protein [Nitrosopumilaceae archaeon]